MHPVLLIVGTGAALYALSRGGKSVPKIPSDANKLDTTARTVKATSGREWLVRVSAPNAKDQTVTVAQLKSDPNTWVTFYQQRSTGARTLFAFNVGKLTARDIQLDWGVGS